MSSVVFAHGKESGPQGIKITALAEVARRRGWRTLSPDFRGIADPRRRVEVLLAAARPLSGPLLLVGSSMGGYVVTAASAELQPVGLFLMAPALGLPAYPGSDVAPVAARVRAVHGWSDTVVPAENVIEWARRHRVMLTLVDDQHNLQASLSLLKVLFERLLEECTAPGKGLVPAL